MWDRNREETCKLRLFAYYRDRSDFFFAAQRWTQQELEELPSDSVEVLQKPFSLTTLRDTIHWLIGWPQVMAPVQKMKAVL